MKPAENNTEKRSPYVDQASTRFREVVVGSGDQSHRYFEAGHSSVPLVVVYTGGVWRAPAAHEALAEGRRIIRLVVPGFVHDYGETAMSVGSHAEVIDQLELMLDEIGVDAFDLTGSSLAACFALSLAVARSASVRSLVLVSPAILIPQDPSWRPAVTPEELQARMFAEGSDVGLPTVKTENIDKLGVRVDLLLTSDDRARLASDLASLRTRSLVVFGAGDLLIPSSLGESYVTTMPNASLAIVDGSGHVPEVEQPQIFAEIVAQFLDNE